MLPGDHTQIIRVPTALCIGRRSAVIGGKRGSRQGHSECRLQGEPPDISRSRGRAAYGASCMSGQEHSEGDGGLVASRPLPWLEARTRLGCQTAGELGAPAISSIPERLPGHEPASARKGYEGGPRSASLDAAGAMGDPRPKRNTVARPFRRIRQRSSFSSHSSRSAWTAGTGLHAPIPPFRTSDGTAQQRVSQTLGGPPSITRRAGWPAASGTLNAMTGCVRPLRVNAPISSRVMLSLRRAAARWLSRI